MAWRPTAYLLAGELDNTTPGKITGWLQFAGLPERVTFKLHGDFHRDIRGTKVRLTGAGQSDDPEAAEYMAGLAVHQTGKVGDMTAGLPPQDYVNYPYYARSAVMLGSACRSHRSCGGAAATSHNIRALQA